MSAFFSGDDGAFNDFQVRELDPAPHEDRQLGSRCKSSRTFESDMYRRGWTTGNALVRSSNPANHTLPDMRRSVMAIPRSKYSLQAWRSIVLGKRIPDGYGLDIIGRIEGYRTGTYLPACHTLTPPDQMHHTSHRCVVGNSVISRVEIASSEWRG